MRANNTGERRSRGDLIEAYKIITGKESTQWERFFELAPSKVTRGHRCKLFKKRKGTLWQKFFSARVVDLWNELDDTRDLCGIRSTFYFKTASTIATSIVNTASTIVIHSSLKNI